MLGHYKVDFLNKNWFLKGWNKGQEEKETDREIDRDRQRETERESIFLLKEDIINAHLEFLNYLPQPSCRLFPIQSIILKVDLYLYACG